MRAVDLGDIRNCFGSVRALHSQTETLHPLQIVLFSLFLVLSNGLRPCCTGALPGGSHCSLSHTSYKFLLAYRIHDGVNEAKTMAVTPFNRETICWRHVWSRQSEKSKTVLLEQAKLGSRLSFSFGWSPSSCFQRPSGSCPLGNSCGDSPGIVSAAACESLASQGAVAPGKGRFLVCLIPQWRLCCVGLIRDCCFIC